MTLAKWLIDVATDSDDLILVGESLVSNGPALLSKLMLVRMCASVSVNVLNLLYLCSIRGLVPTS